MIPTEQRLVPREPQKTCAVCQRPALCRNYGVLTCDACKMFFRRAIFENLLYTCSENGKCLEEAPPPGRICRGCRIRKCFELGMDYVPTSMNILEVKNKKDDDLTGLLKDLKALDSSWHMKMLYFQTEEDPSLAEVLEGKYVALTKRTTQLTLSQHNLSYFSIYIHVSSMMNFGFVQQLSTRDKLILFRDSSSKTKVLSATMKRIEYARERGQEMYPQALMRVLNIDEGRLKRVCYALVCRLLELKVTAEEMLLLRLIFFCNPGVTDERFETTPSLSAEARSILSIQQKEFTSALFQYCQIKYGRSAPARLADLLSLSSLVSKVDEDVKYIAMLFQCYMPSFKFHKLAIDTLQLSNNSEN